MSESDSDEFFSAEEDSLFTLSNTTHKHALVDRHSEQLETPVNSISERDNTNSFVYCCEGDTIQPNAGDLANRLIERNITQVVPVTDHSVHKLDISPESCQIILDRAERDDNSNMDSVIEKQCSTLVDSKQFATESTTCEYIHSVLDPIQLEAVRTEVLARKESGNCLYREQDFSSARDSYSSALELCPRELSLERAVLFSNRSLCLLKLGEHQLALADCSQALLIDPKLKKAKVRRAQLYERTGKLEEALSDYSQVLESDPSCLQAREAVPRLTAEAEAQREALKMEALSKLRDLGDMVLKPFGISTNDFNFVQDPNTGNYSVSFGKNN